MNILHPINSFECSYLYLSVVYNAYIVYMRWWYIYIISENEKQKDEMCLITSWLRLIVLYSKDIYRQINGVEYCIMHAV